MSIPPIHNKSRSPLIGLVLVILLYAMASMAQASVLGFVEAESTDNSVQDMVMSPDGKFVYEVKLTSSESHIDLFTRDTVTGMLDFIEYTHTLNGTLSMDFIKGIAMSPDGKHLYATGTIDPFAQVIIWFDRNATTGHLTYGGHLTSGNDGDFQGLENPCGSMAISPDGYYLYAGDIGGSGGIVVFQRASNGVLTWLQTTTKAYDDTYFSNINSVSLSPDGKNLYAISTIHGELYVFSIDDTSGRVTNTQRLISVTFDAADGIPGIDNAKQTVVSQDGRFLYLVGKIENIRNNSSDDDYDVVTFQRDASNGSLNFVSNTTSIVQNGSNAEYDSLDLSSTVILSPDPDQNYLYVGTQSSDAINVFRRDKNSGGLDWAGWVTHGVSGVTLGDVRQLAVSSDGAYVYAACGSRISVFDTRADLSLVKTDDIDPISPAGTLTYTLSATNNGPADAQNVVVTDTLPAGAGYLRSSVNTPGGSCSESGGTVTCSLGDLPATAAVNSTIEVTVPTSTGSITNTASVDAYPLDPDTSNNSDSEDTEISDSGVSSTPAPTTGDSSSGGGGALDPSGLAILTALLLFTHRRAQSAKRRSVS